MVKFCLSLDCKNDFIDKNSGMKLVANMDFEINTYIPGIRIKTSPTDFIRSNRCR